MDDALGNKKIDITVAGLKSLAGVIPYAGSVVAELIGQVIPGQRLDRVANFVREVDRRLSELERKEFIKSEPFVDIFEDATLQSLRALSQERIAILAGFVADAAKFGEESYDVDKRLLQIISDLTDTDLEVLTAYDERKAVHLMRKLKGQARASRAYRDLSDEEKNVQDARDLAWELSISALSRAGLLVPILKQSDSSRPGGLEMEKKTGLPKASSYHVSRLGQLLVRRISK